MSEKTQCRKCSTWILVETAEDTNGRCMPCYKARFYYIKRPLEIAALVLLLACGLLSLPFIGVYKAISRRLRFPFDLKRIKAELFNLVNDKNHFSQYYGALLEGYSDPTRYICGHMHSCPHNVAGIKDGRDIKRGFMDFEELLKFERIKKISLDQD